MRRNTVLSFLKIHVSSGLVLSYHSGSWNEKENSLKETIFKLILF